MTRTELAITFRAIAGRRLAPAQINEMLAAAIAYATSDNAGLCEARRDALERALDSIPGPDAKQVRRRRLERQREGGRRGGLAKAANARAKASAA